MDLVDKKIIIITKSQLNGEGVFQAVGTVLGQALRQESSGGHREKASETSLAQRTGGEDGQWQGCWVGSLDFILGCNGGPRQSLCLEWIGQRPEWEEEGGYCKKPCKESKWPEPGEAVKEERKGQVAMEPGRRRWIWRRPEDFPALGVGLDLVHMNRKALNEVF